MLEMRRFIAAHGITKFQVNRHFPVNTLLIVRAVIVADAADSKHGDPHRHDRPPPKCRFLTQLA